VRQLLTTATDALFLVVGARGTDGFRGLRLGPVSDQVARHAPCPVVVVPIPAVIVAVRAIGRSWSESTARPVLRLLQPSRSTRRAVVRRNCARSTSSTRPPCRSWQTFRKQTCDDSTSRRRKPRATCSQPRASTHPCVHAWGHGGSTAFCTTPVAQSPLSVGRRNGRARHRGEVCVEWTEMSRQADSAGHAAAVH
jgi:hypothetical protein